MSGKKDKARRRLIEKEIKKNKNLVVAEIIGSIREANIFHRLKLAGIIIFKIGFKKYGKK